MLFKGLKAIVKKSTSIISMYFIVSLYTFAVGFDLVQIPTHLNHDETISTILYNIFECKKIIDEHV